MLKSAKINSVIRILDANINRSKEGLRVCEEVVRFVLENRSLTQDFKKIRHELDAGIKGLISREILLKQRSSLSDVGEKIYINELKRSGLKDVFFANIQRVKESVRVLEEFSKLVNTRSALKFKALRYKIYEIEKKAVKKVSALSAY